MCEFVLCLKENFSHCQFVVFRLFVVRNGAAGAGDLWMVQVLELY